MDTNRLRQFAVLTETANFRKASELLGISHSGLSKSMRALEEEIGQPLFQKQGRGVVVTDAGRKLALRCPSFFQELARLLDRPAKKESNAELPYRLGAFEVFTAVFLSRFVRAEFPERMLEVYELSPGRLEEALLLDRIDAGITYEPIPRSGIEYSKVASVQMGVYRKRGPGPTPPLTELPFIAPIAPLEGVPTGVRGSDAWSETKLPRTIRYRVDSLTTGMEFLREGLGAIFIPRFFAESWNGNSKAEDRCEEVALPRGTRSVRRDVFLVKRESTPAGAEWKKLSRALKRLN